MTRFNYHQIRQVLEAIVQRAGYEPFTYDKVKDAFRPNQLGALRRRGYLRVMQPASGLGKTYVPTVWQATEQTRWYLGYLHGEVPA